MELANIGKLYNLADLEPVLGVSRRTLLSYISNGKLRAFKLGQKWKVTESALAELLEQGKEK